MFILNTGCDSHLPQLLNPVTCVNHNWMQQVQSHSQVVVRRGYGKMLCNVEYQTPQSVNVGTSRQYIKTLHHEVNPGKY